jgi:hypothetical protein
MLTIATKYLRNHKDTFAYRVNIGIGGATESSDEVERRNRAAPNEDALSRSSIHSLACSVRRTVRGLFYPADTSLHGRSAGCSAWATSRRPWLTSPAGTVSLRPRRFGILPRCGPASTSVYWRSPHAAHPASLTDRPALPVSAFATVLLTHGQSFGSPSANITPSVANQPSRALLGASFARSDATLSRVGAAAGLTHDRSNRLSATPCLPRHELP